MIIDLEKLPGSESVVSGDHRVIYHDIHGEEIPVDGHIDALMSRLGEEYYPVGFDTRGTPFGDLSCQHSVYGDGYDALTLGAFCDGYIFGKPLSQHQGTTAIPDFVNEANIERARQTSWNPKYRDASPQDFYWAAVKDAALTIKYRHLR